MKLIFKLLTCLTLTLMVTGGLYAYFSEKGDAIAAPFLLAPKESKAVFATHGKNVYWLTASIDEYENQPDSVVKVKYAD